MIIRNCIMHLCMEVHKYGHVSSYVCKHACRDALSLCCAGEWISGSVCMYFAKYLVDHENNLEVE